MDPKTKFWLFKQSKHFCAVPWNHYEIRPDGAVHTCSKGKILGNINQDNIDDILQSDKLLAIKKDLINDLPNENCTSCKTLSTGSDHFDLRNHYNPMFKSVDIDYDNINEFQLNGIDLHWDNTCNFKCIYCSPYFSSSIAQEQGQPVVRTDKKNIERISSLIEQQQYSIKELYLSGGEPLLVKYNAQLLQRLENTDLPIRINSNISHATDDNPVFAELKRFRNVLWTISVDSRKERFDYIRTGGNWIEFLENINNIKNLNHQMRINSVWCIVSMADMFDTIRYFITEHNITDVTVNQLVFNESLRVRNAPTELKEQARDKLYKLLNSKLFPEYSNTWYNLSRCKRELDHPIEDSAGYQDYLDSLDKIRGTNWRKVFTELT